MAFAGGMALIGWIGPFTREEWLPGWLLLLGSIAAIAWYLLDGARGAPLKLRERRLLPIAMVALVGASGLVWAFGTTTPWRSDRIDQENLAYRATVQQLLDQKVDYSALDRRPSRLDPGDDYDLRELRDVYWNRAVLTGEYAVGGLINLKGTLTTALLEEAMLDERTGTSFAAFLSAPGTVVSAADSERTTVADYLSCIDAGECGPASVEPTGYQVGRMEYEVDSPTEVDALFNEASYEGWQASACDGDVCEPLEVGRNSEGLLQIGLPAGDYRLIVQYETPGRAVGWMGFAVGLLAMIAFPTALAIRRARQKADSK